MKGIIRFLSVGLLVLIAAGAAVWLVPAWHVQATVWGLRTGVLPVEKADWGYLKLRSGRAGLDALEALERNGPDKVAQAAVAVQQQWFEKGHHFYGQAVGRSDNATDHETRFAELHLPGDGKRLPRNLKPGETIPDSFWRSARFRAGCPPPPPRAQEHLPGWPVRQDVCQLRLEDVTGDGQAEIVVDNIIHYGKDDFAIPAAREEWTVFGKHGEDWTTDYRLRSCVVTEEALSHSISHVAPPVDLPYVDGHYVNFFDGDCWDDHAVDDIRTDLVRSAAMASRLSAVPLMAGSRPIPTSLAAALRAQSIIQPLSGEPPYPPYISLTLSFRGLPPCFSAADPKGCAAFVHDFDHDGKDDVVIFDGQVQSGEHDWRLATLLSEKDGQWQVVGNRPACADANTPLDRTKVDARPAFPRPIAFAGRLYLPGGEDGNACHEIYLVL